MKFWAVTISAALHVAAFLIFLRSPLVQSESPIWIEQGGAPGVKSSSRTPMPSARPIEKALEGESGPIASAGNSDTTIHSTVEQWTAWGNAPPEYPYLAQKKGWEGKVEVRITISPDEPSQVSLEKSSGHSILDDAALEWARHARVNVSRRTEYLVPIIFRMATDR